MFKTYMYSVTNQEDLIIQVAQLYLHTLQEIEESEKDVRIELALDYKSIPDKVDKVLKLGKALEEESILREALIKFYQDSKVIT